MKKFLLIGGTRGIGQAILKGLVQDGSEVVFTYRSSLDLAKEITETYKNVYAYELDLNSDQVEYQIKKILNNHETFDGIICNAGVTDDGFLLLKEEQRWKNVVETNLFGPYKIIKETLPALLRNRGQVNKSIIFVSSVSSIVGVIGQTDYCASKAGLIGLTKSLAHELAKSKIRVNAISPGYIESDMTNKLSPELKKRYKSEILLKRFGEPSEVADLISFLVSDKATYINGQNIVIDGGLTC